MTSPHPVDRDRVRSLMMAALDAEISAAERDELEEALAGHPDLSAEWRRFLRLKEVTGTMAAEEPPREIWDGYWQATYRRAERALAWILVSAGATILVAFGVWHAIQVLLGDTSIPVSVRLGLGALGAGLAILAVSVLREKVFMARRDPYQKEIVR